MQAASPRLVGVELYFDDLGTARGFYQRILGLELGDEDPDHYARFDAGEAFLCLERTGSSPTPHTTRRCCSSRSPI
jgi:predicted enzyme related to lactoylglutathione lyase